MTKIRFFCVLTALLLLTACQQAPDGETPGPDGEGIELGVINDEAEEVSITQIIENPEEYHGKVVRVTGVGQLDMEGNILFLHKEDYDSSNVRNALWINLNEEIVDYDEAAKLNGKYVLVEGTFDMENSGGMGLYSGAVSGITRYKLDSDKR